MCSNGTCICNALYKGADCAERTCQSDCSGHGRCCFHYKCKTKAKPTSFIGTLAHIMGISDEKTKNLETLTEDEQPEEVTNNPNGFAVSPTCICQKGYGGG